ncbi:MAG: hypothetical protein NTW10_13525 [Bacteroidetes bacterium]|nr:hypothetical protein [Bacteroidota bacterium]
MTRKSILRKLIFFPLTIAAFLLCTGSLINFHQYRIWHRPLILEFVAYKRDSEKTAGQFGVKDFAHPNPVHFISLDAIFSSFVEFPACSVRFSPVLTFSSRIPELLRHGIHGLRAPPLA